MSLLHSEPGRQWPWLSFGSLGIMFISKEPAKPISPIWGYCSALAFLCVGVIFFWLAVRGIQSGEIYVDAKDKISILDARLYTRNDTPKEFAESVRFYFICGTGATLLSVFLFRQIWKESRH
jgi:drug/metabolite transporter (DMT)-like permease